ncbi:hypothetical protein C1H46_020996 [Malus baccata]|uniref:Uncharacterized protein n=1 Tax=Malus baccata TaxID=106549 RepID=A0A540M3T4_MALBA|nr:hypothetical protein C1H46_020996 [Malus baccata]
MLGEGHLVIVKILCIGSLGVTSIEIQTINPSDTWDGGILWLKGLLKLGNQVEGGNLSRLFMAPLEQQVQRDFETAIVVEETPAEETYSLFQSV